MSATDGVTYPIVWMKSSDIRYIESGTVPATPLSSAIATAAVPMAATMRDGAERLPLARRRQSTKHIRNSERNGNDAVIAAHTVITVPGVSLPA